MSKRPIRKNRDSKTIKAMIKIYCHGRHIHEGELCTECEELLGYAVKRIDRCPLKGRQTTCSKCTVHCYTPIMREKVINVMRYPGPRMLYRHPILTLLHLFDGIKPGFRSGK